MRSVLAAVLLAGPALATDVSEYVGLAPPNSDSVSWVKVTYPANFSGTSTSEVSIEDVSTSTTVDELGAWNGLSLGGEPMLTARVSGDNLYAQLYTGTAPDGDDYPGGCCADTLRTFAKDSDGAYSDIDIYTLVKETVGQASDTQDNWAYANHAFELSELEGVGTVALIDVAYRSSSLNGALADAILCVDVSTGEVVKTADGDSFFSWFDKLGTMSTSSSDSIYAIQFFELSNSGNYLDEDVQQAHQNGITHFTTTYNGTEAVTVLGATHKSHGEAVLVKCPFTYTSANGGGAILQRFGSPFTYDTSGNQIGSHTFGLSADSNSITALHNIHYTKYQGGPNDGKETLTLFVNEQDGSSVSQVYEFELNLIAEEDAGAFDDTVFATSYTHGSLSFSENTWGGARPIGYGGLWLVGRDGIEALAAASSGSHPEGPPPPEDDHSGPPSNDDHSSGTTSVYDSFISVSA